MNTQLVDKMLQQSGGVTPDMEKFQRSVLRHTRIRTVACVLLLAAVLLVLLALVPKAYDTLNDVQSAVNNIGSVAAALDKADIPGLRKQLDGMLYGMEALMADGQNTLAAAAGGMEKAIGKIEELDIASLNGAIGDLAAVVEPLARLFGR